MSYGIEMINEEDTFNKFYITTTLPYANAIPHVGHAIEFFQADAYARYFRRKLGKDNVFFNVGVDEHGLKVLTTAKRHGTTPDTLSLINRVKCKCTIYLYL